MLDRNKVRDVPSRAHRRSVAWLGRDDQRLAETFRKGPANLAGIHAGKAYAVERAGLNWHERYELEDGGARATWLQAGHSREGFKDLLARKGKRA